ncbi:GAF domain-containing protein [Streptomyces sp. B6B3]|uniref:GAF domain-containing sensor histidine kinase n=1 Tax=Streptomyces sp. B6B3 TaxID=3153570 RepID=UPI00325D496C
MRLDELLEELQARIDEARGTRDRVHSLLEAVLSVGRELDLPQVLRSIVEAAVVLVDAEYGALGVIGGHGRLSQFLPVGVTEEQIAAIGPLPSGHGLLGELIRHPEALRLPHLSQHPNSHGFPPNHPPMDSFLGVPIRVRDEVFGNLYLTEKRGGGEFDAEDESVLSTLAVAAGVAIENARLYEQSRHRQRWLEANSEIIGGLLSGADGMPALELIVGHARRILGADLGLLALPEGEGDDLRVALVAGPGAEAHRDLRLPRVGSFVGAAVLAGEPVTSEDISVDPRASAAGTARWAGLGPAVAVPMRIGESMRGALLLVRSARQAAFAADETASLLTFAGQAALAMELAERRRTAERLSVLEDRDRIARDLHDLAIQRLFATGMTLQSAVRFVKDPQASDRLLRAVDDLDETIKIIRSTIFGLRAHESGPAVGGLRVRMARTVEEFVPTLGFTPSLLMEGLLDTDVPSDVADDVVAVLGEALSNVSRHARAGSTAVALTVRSGELCLVVSDDGVGLPTDSGGRRSGLRNLAERAERLGGALALDVPDGGGTRLTWRVPVPRR